MSSIFDMLDDFGKRTPSYSAAELEAAKKIARKTGKSVMEVLQESAAKKKSSSKPHSSTVNKPNKPNSSMDSAVSQAQSYTSTMGELLNNMQKDQKKADDSAASMNQMLADLAAQNQKDIEALADSTQLDLEELRKNIARDFGITEKATSVNSSADTSSTQSQPPTLESFNGVVDTLSQHVFGQKTLLKKLNVAFKRPFILPAEENHARNSFYIYGPKDSGKHHALKQMTAELAKRGILTNSTVYEMDLSRYSAAGKDNVFLQDLYVALQSENDVILFENFETCHISYLSYINDLVIKGECYLQDRYTLQKGQLINVANAFTKETVSTFTAQGKYLVFLSVKDVENLANVFGAPFINALGDICPSEKLTEESFRKIAKVQWDALVEKAKKQLFFLLTAEEEPILAQAVAATGKNTGTQGLISFFDKVLKGLATLKLEGDYEKDQEVKLYIEETSLMAEIDGEKIDVMDNLPAAYTGDLAAVKAELANIVGLEEIKKYILSLEEYYNTQKRRQAAGLKASDVSKHMIFTGNPGTGKTTIARIISRYLKAIGILSGGQLVEVSRADLVGRFVGHTAPLVNQVVSSAIGGVLFIDEAYSLYRGKDDQFGLEAIDTLVKAIEDNRDNLIVILAGYSVEMAQFLESNSGLKSRFPNIIDFPDYTGEELLAITKITVKSKGYVMDEACDDALLAFYIKVQALMADTAGNGRLVRNKVEEAILNQSRRLVAEPGADLSLLKVEDFELD